MTGTVAEFGGSRGYGWVLGDDAVRYFAHTSEIWGGAALTVGDRVTFKADLTARGPRATGIRRIPRLDAPAAPGG